MSMDEAKSRGFVAKNQGSIFDTMDAWPAESAEPLTLQSAIDGVLDPKEKARLNRLIAMDNLQRLDSAQTALGTGSDVNSLAWQELMERMRSGRRA